MVRGEAALFGCSFAILHLPRTHSPTPTPTHTPLCRAAVKWVHARAYGACGSLQLTPGKHVQNWELGLIVFSVALWLGLGGQTWATIGCTAPSH